MPTATWPETPAEKEIETRRITQALERNGWPNPTVADLRRLAFARWLYLAGKLSDET